MTFALIALYHDWQVFWSRPFHSTKEVSLPIHFTIQKGENLNTVAKRLEQQKIITRPFYFKLKLMLCSQSLHLGHYVITTSMNPRDFLHQLQYGKEALKKFRIHEGWRWEDLHNALNENQFITHHLLSPQDKENFSQALGYGTLEGIFAPDTYFFGSGISDKELLTIAADEQKQRLSHVSSNEGFLSTPLAILTLASIIEKEGNNLNDDKIISSVFHNRLHCGMRLQSDATVFYALNIRAKKLCEKELLTQAPHNTYTIDGLPPTPIAYPSKDAIIAAVYPETTDFLFFLMDKHGHLICSKEFKDHIEAKKQM
jgi:UPF0755 protein